MKTEASSQNQDLNPVAVSPLFDEAHRATYCPEDNKLRLYVGRVPRDQYLKLRADGWVALHKQREAGGGDFAATWTPSRRDTAIDYAGVIEDEDMSPADRAADRAERFSGYRDKRTAAACGHADRYEAQPAAHGFQDVKKAEMAVARREKIGTRAVDAWSKAEYWTRRTAGVISHALYKSTPAVRMGRIKELEAHLRKEMASLDERAKIFRDFEKIAAIADTEKQNRVALQYVGSRNIWANYIHPRAAELPENNRSKTNKTSLYSLLSDEQFPITGAEACALFFSNHSMPGTETEWTQHLKLRLAYENQMLEAQGGRAAFVEMIAGGFIGDKQIQKVNKSAVTGRVVSVALRFRTHGLDRWGNPDPDAPEFRNEVVNIERAGADVYRPPTADELAAFQAEQKAAKAKAKVARAETAIPLINPTDADAQRLQDIWNEARKAELDDYDKKRFEPATVCRITQAVYSANSKGAYAKAETRGLRCLGVLTRPNSWNMYSRSLDAAEAADGPEQCKIRVTGFNPYRVVVITDKPQKPIPAGVWEKYVAPQGEQSVSELVNA